MNIIEIERLLELYYKGETSLLEEKQLRCFFMQDDIGDKFNADKQLFLSLNSIGDTSLIDIPSGLERELSLMIDAQDKAKRRRSIFSLKLVRGVAMSLLVFISIGVVLSTFNERERAEGDLEAQQKTVEALILVSVNLNKGLETLSTANNQINSAIKLVSKNVEK